MANEFTNVLTESMIELKEGASETIQDVAFAMTVAIMRVPELDRGALYDHANDFLNRLLSEYKSQYRASEKDMSARRFAVEQIRARRENIHDYQDRILEQVESIEGHLARDKTVLEFEKQQLKIDHEVAEMLAKQRREEQRLAEEQQLAEKERLAAEAAAQAQDNETSVETPAETLTDAPQVESNPEPASPIANTLPTLPNLSTLAAPNLPNLPNVAPPSDASSAPESVDKPDS